MKKEDSKIWLRNTLNSSNSQYNYCMNITAAEFEINVRSGDEPVAAQVESSADKEFVLSLVPLSEEFHKISVQLTGKDITIFPADLPVSVKSLFSLID